MDSVDSGKVKKINWTRSKLPLDIDYQHKNPDECKDAGETSRVCDSLQLSTYKSPMTSNLRPSFALPLQRTQKVEDWCLNRSIILTGTACRGSTGPPVGVVDIGVSENAYYFCMALPGAKKDPGEFSCDISRDGRVCVQGVTSTGGKTVVKYTRVFEMKFQQQCPSGPFSVFFNLPGPVDPRLFSPAFRSDGIFEGVVAKLK